MRLSITRTLTSLSASSTSGKPITDSDIIRWANDIVASGTGGAPAVAKANKIRSFADKGLGDGIFFLELLDGLKKGYVDWSLVESGKDEVSCKANGSSLLSSPHSSPFHSLRGKYHERSLTCRTMIS